MRALAVDLMSWACIVAGGFFTVAGAVGLVRMPELYTRMHAASVIDTLGAGLLCIGMMLQAGPTLVAVKLVFILALLFFIGPVVTHALAQAALHAGVEPQLDDDRRHRLDEASPDASARDSSPSHVAR